MNHNIIEWILVIYSLRDKDDNRCKDNNNY